jgi:hypothetical protein
VARPAAAHQGRRAGAGRDCPAPLTPGCRQERMTSPRGSPRGRGIPGSWLEARTRHGASWRVWRPILSIARSRSHAANCAIRVCGW